MRRRTIVRRRPIPIRTFTIAWRRWKISRSPAARIRPWDESIAPTAQFVLHVRDQLLRELRQAMRTAKPCTARASDLTDSSCPEARCVLEPGEAVRRGLLAAFPDRLVRRSGPGSRFGRMVGGRGVRVVESSAVRNAPLFLAVDVDRGGSEALVRQASAVERDWLPADRLALRTEVEFDAASRPRDRPPPRLLGRPALGRKPGAVARRR